MKTIFVSSTFKDMHFERDAIQEITLPALRTEAMKYGESVSFCDLRWGINTGDLDSEEGSRKVLDVCLDEIDRCKPPMVVILGDRYGWIPSEDLTTSAADRKNLDKAQLKRDMELEDLQISVTALEIAYGALSTPEKRSQALFYFRHIEPECPDDYAVEDSEHKKKLDHLKAKIEALTGGRIKHYYVRWDGEKLDGVIPFAEMLAEDISKILLPEWKQKELLTPFERERLTHWSFITEKNEMFSARSALVHKYYDDLTQNDKHFLAIKAPSGSGKSMLFSNLALKLRDGGYDVVPFMSGLTSESNDSVDILRNAIYYIEDLLGFSHESADFSFNGIEGSTEPNGEEPKEKKNGIDKLRERLFELCVECEQANKRVVIMVDAVDQLALDDNRDNLIFIPERLSDNVKFVMTCLPELAVPGYDCVTINPMDTAEKRLVVLGILGAHHRQIEDNVIEMMLELKASSNPLFLSLLVQRLLMMNHEDFFAINAKQMDAMKAISERQMEVLQSCPDSLQDMSAALVTEAGKRINEELVRKVIEYLAISRHGLRKDDLAALLGDKWSELDFTHFVTYLNESFMRRDDGRFDFSHKCIRDGVLNLCVSQADIHRQLLHHFEKLPIEDLVKTQETVYHCLKANDKPAFVSFVSKCHSSILNNNYAVKDVYNFSMLDDGEWICDILSDLNGDAMSYVSEFVSSVFNSNGTTKQVAVSKKVLKKNVESIVGCTYCGNDARIHIVRSLAYFSFAELCGKMGGGECWQERYDAYISSIDELNAAKAIDNNIDIRFDLSQRMLSIGNLYVGQREQHNTALDYYKKATAILEKLYSENESAKYRGALSNAYLSIGKLYSLHTENKDYLWRAISYYDQASTLITATGDNSAFFEQLAKTYYSVATVYQVRDGHDDNIRKAYEYYKKAISYYEKLVWRSAPENIWISIARCYYEQAVLLLLAVKRIVEEKNKVFKAFQNRPFDPVKEQDYIRESADCFRKAIQYYEKLADLGYDNLDLPRKTATALYMLAGVTAMMPDCQGISNEDYLARGRENISNLKASFTDDKLFELYYEIHEIFGGLDAQYPGVRAVVDDCVAYFNEVLEKMRNDPNVDQQAVQLLEIQVFGYSKERRKVFWKTLFKLLFELLLIASFESIRSFFSPKKKKLKSKVRNNVDKTIEKKARDNLLSQQDKASSSMLFGVLSTIGSCVVLPCKYLLRLMTPFLFKISGDSQSVIQVFLWYDRFAIFASLLFLGLGLYACISAFRSKKAALKIAIIALALSIISSVVLLFSLNGNNYFENQYSDALSLMDSGRYEEAIEIFESLRNYEDSVNKIDECNTAILEKKYEYAIGIMNEDNIIEAYEQLIELNDYKDSTQIAESIYNRYKNELLRSAQVGDYVYFGVYEQDNNMSNGKEPIRWLVIDQQDGKLLLISEYILDCFQYHDVYEDVTWEKSLLRDWLNSDFYAVAFSKEEQGLISLSMVKADTNRRYPTSQGAATQDNVFVLSIDEAEKYFDSQEARRGKATVYVKNSRDRYSNSCDWWLRTIGIYQNYVSYVAGTTGIINRAGESVNTDRIGVRPAMWIKLPNGNSNN